MAANIRLQETFHSLNPGQREFELHATKNSRQTSLPEPFAGVRKLFDAPRLKELDNSVDNFCWQPLQPSQSEIVGAHATPITVWFGMREQPSLAQVRRFGTGVDMQKLRRHRRKFRHAVRAKGRKFCGSWTVRRLWRS
ncbi:hypothetical protein HC256_006716 [Beauveria bassiana]|nr:hypothetical protein HC256_006716 [Beauveria bassiana]